MCPTKCMPLCPMTEVAGLAKGPVILVELELGASSWTLVQVSSHNRQ